MIEGNELSFFEKEFIKKYYGNLDYDGVMHELPKENIKETIYKDCKEAVVDLFYIFHRHEGNCEKIIRNDQDNLEVCYDEAIKDFIRLKEVDLVRELVQTKDKKLEFLDEKAKEQVFLSYARIMWRSGEYKDVFLQFLMMNRRVRDIANNVRYDNDGYYNLFGDFKYPDELIELDEDFIQALIECAPKYGDFDSLYDDVLEAYKERRLDASIDLPYSNRGKWLHFGSNTFSFQEYLENYLQLEHLFKYVWKNNYYFLELLLGDCYVFVDELGIPKISLTIVNGEVNNICGTVGRGKKVDSEYESVLNEFVNLFDQEGKYLNDVKKSIARKIYSK